MKTLPTDPSEVIIDYHSFWARGVVCKGLFIPEKDVRSAVIE